MKKKVKLILGGRGYETYVHNINEEQKERLVNADIENQNPNYDLVCEILGIDNHDDNSTAYLGASTDPESFYIGAFDENDNVIWESDENFEFNEELEDHWWDEVETDGSKLLIVDYVKGNFHEYVLELEEDFDPQKLSPVYLDISEIIQILKSLKYDGKEIEIDEWGDYWSKGLYYHLYP